MWYGRYSVSGSGDKMLILISFWKGPDLAEWRRAGSYQRGRWGKRISSTFGQDFTGLDLFLCFLIFHDCSKTHKTTRLITEHKAMFHLTAEQIVKEVGKGLFGEFARLAKVWTCNLFYWAAVLVVKTSIDWMKRGPALVNSSRPL